MGRMGKIDKYKEKVQWRVIVFPLSWQGCSKGQKVSSLDAQLSELTRGEYTNFTWENSKLPYHCSYCGTGSISVRGMCTCWLSQTLPGEGLPLLPLIQLPHGVVPHRPPLLRRGDGGGGGGAEGPVIHGARHAADAVGPHHAVAGQRAVALWVAGHNLRPVTGHVPG